MVNKWLPDCAANACLGGLRHPYCENMTKSVLLRIIVGAFAVTALLLLAAWAAGAFVGLSGHGAAALILGTVLSMGLGIGLMVAVFASSRSGHDESVSDIARPDDRQNDR